MRIIVKVTFLGISVFAIIGTIVASQTSLFFSIILDDGYNGKVESNIFMRMVAAENHYFSQNLEADGENLLSNVIKVATNINIKDVRSLIYDEIPGLYSMTSEIIVAGEGADFTNLPIESSPPLEELLKDREVNEDSLGEIKDRSPNPPVERPEKNTVFIYHSHNRESFNPHLKDSGQTSNVQHKEVNVTMVGERLGNKLLEHGIGTVVDKTDIATILNKRGWKFGKSYEASREVVVEALAENDDYVYLLDIHRDSAPRKSTTTTINGETYARLYFVIGASHPNYKENEKFANELHQKLEEKYPGLSKGVYKKSKAGGNNGIYNQDLSPNSVVIEIGGVDNTLDELYNTADVLAEVFAEYYWQNSDALEVSGTGEK
jgi:stage II sporulation protein P